MEALQFFWRVFVGAETARRLTEHAGAAYVDVQAAECARIRRELPEPPTGPAVQQLSLDGALVHATDGEWVEVKTAVVGEVERRRERDGGLGAHATALSYFSRADPVERFTDDLLVEVERRGTQTAGVVVSVNDGAAWIQGVLDQYRRDAVRILDFAHATEHLAEAASATFGRDTAAMAAWMDEQAAALKDQGPAPVLTAVRALPLAEAADPAGAREVQEQTLGYFLSRLDQVQYPTFAAAGYPIGSGAVESAGKHVIQARLKGSGMRWSRTHLNPLAALRTVVCSGRWAEAWPQIHQHLRAQQAQHHHARWLRHHPPPLPAPAPPTLSPTERARLRTIARHLRTGRPHPSYFKDGRPTAGHPWRRPLRRPTQAS